MRALSDKDTYATALQQRYATFNRWYPRLMKGALVLGVAVPVVLAVIFALTPTEKVWLLTGWLIWIIVIFVALVVIVAAVILILRMVNDARTLQKTSEKGGHINTFREDVHELFNGRFHITLLTLPTLAWALAGLLAAIRLFRWEPRH